MNHAPLCFRLLILVLILTLPGRALSAVQPGETLTHNLDYLPTHAPRASVDAELGCQDEAERTESRRLCPLGSLELGRQRLPCKEPQGLQRILDALYKAGLR